MIVKHVIIDLDGPILDGKMRHYFCYKQILQECGFRFLGLDKYWNHKRAAIDRMGLLSLTGATEIYNEFLEKWLLMIESREALSFDRLQDGAFERMVSWKAMGFHLTLVTMRRDFVNLKKQLSSFGILGLFDDVLKSNYADGGIGKAKILMDNYESISAKSCVWIGDTEADYAASSVLGCNLILVSNGLRNEEYLRKLRPYKIVNCISDVLLI